MRSPGGVRRHCGNASFAAATATGASRVPRGLRRGSRSGSARGCASGRPGRSFDQVGDALRLREVELAVQERAFGELPGLGEPRTEIEAALRLLDRAVGQVEPHERDQAAAGALPAARKLLAEQNLQAADLSGTGRGGRVTKGDVLAAVEAKSDGARPAAPAPAAPKSAPGVPLAQ